jgi:hypothetical protein
VITQINLQIRNKSARCPILTFFRKGRVFDSRLPDFKLPRVPCTSIPEFTPLARVPTFGRLLAFYETAGYVKVLVLAFPLLALLFFAPFSRVVSSRASIRTRKNCLRSVHVGVRW